MAITAAVIGALGGSFSKGWIWDQTLTGWTTSGSIAVSGSVGNPAPGVSAPTNSYAYRQAPGFPSLAGRTIEFDILANAGVALCGFYFGCNSSGAGQYFRLECRSGNNTGIGATPSWSNTAPAVPSSPVTGARSPNTWYSVKIIINPAGTSADVYIDGSLVISAHSITLNGNYIGMHGDAGAGGAFDNIKIS